MLHHYSFSEYICYDDGCHLRRYARNPVRSQLTQLTPCTIQLSEIEIVIAKMHMAGHIDRWCLENCDPKLFTDLNEVRRVKSEFSLQSSSMHVFMHISLVYIQVDTEVCEQCFSWLSKYSKMTRRMSRNTFIFFFCLTCVIFTILEKNISFTELDLCSIPGIQTYINFTIITCNHTL